MLTWGAGSAKFAWGCAAVAFEPTLRLAGTSASVESGVSIGIMGGWRVLWAV